MGSSVFLFKNTLKTFLKKNPFAIYFRLMVLILDIFLDFLDTVKRP